MINHKDKQAATTHILKQAEQGEGAAVDFNNRKFYKTAKPTKRYTVKLSYDMTCETKDLAEVLKRYLEFYAWDLKYDGALLVIHNHGNHVTLTQRSETNSLKQARKRQKLTGTRYTTNNT